MDRHLNQRAFTPEQVLEAIGKQDGSNNPAGAETAAIFRIDEYRHLRGVLCHCGWNPRDLHKFRGGINTRDQRIGLFIVRALPAAAGSGLPPSTEPWFLPALELRGEKERGPSSGQQPQPDTIGVLVIEHIDGCLVKAYDVISDELRYGWICHPARNAGRLLGVVANAREVPLLGLSFREGGDFLVRLSDAFLNSEGRATITDFIVPILELCRTPTPDRDELEFAAKLMMSMALKTQYWREQGEKAAEEAVVVFLRENNNEELDILFGRRRREALSQLVETDDSVGAGAREGAELRRAVSHAQPPPGRSVVDPMCEAPPVVILPEQLERKALAEREGVERPFPVTYQCQTGSPIRYSLDPYSFNGVIYK